MIFVFVLLVVAFFEDEHEADSEESCSCGSSVLGSRQIVPLAKGAARSDGGRDAPRGCRFGLPNPPTQPPEGFAFFPPLLSGTVDWTFVKRQEAAASSYAL